MNNDNDSLILHSRYQILNKLGEGGFGVVYLVKDLQTNNQCVVKQLQSEYQQIETIQRLFQEEVNILKKLDHPQIPRLIDSFDDGKDYFLVQEYIEGNSLKDELNHDQDFSWSEDDVLDFLEQGLFILQYIHSRGVIHRDIKPDNFIRRKDNKKLVLIDFGAVKKFNVEQSQIINLTVAIGTHGYMPSEQARGKPRKNSDIYSLGIIAIEALTGINPMGFKEDEETGEIIWRESVNVNSHLADILAKMVRSDYVKRYHSADLVLQDIKKYQLWRKFVDNSTLTPVQSDLQDKKRSDQPGKKALGLTKITLAKQRKGFLAGLILLIGASVVASFFYFTRYGNGQSQSLITQLDSLVSSQDFVRCIEVTESSEAQEIIPEFRLDYLGECRLQYAIEKANQGELEDAIAIASAISELNIHYDQAQLLIDEWNTKQEESAIDCPPGVLCICPGPLCPN